MLCSEQVAARKCYTPFTTLAIVERGCWPYGNRALALKLSIFRVYTYSNVHLKMCIQYTIKQKTPTQIYSQKILQGWVLGGGFVPLCTVMKSTAASVALPKQHHFNRKHFKHCTGCKLSRGFNSKTYLKMLWGYGNVCPYLTNKSKRLASRPFWRVTEFIH